MLYLPPGLVHTPHGWNPSRATPGLQGSLPSSWHPAHEFPSDPVCAHYTISFSSRLRNPQVLAPVT